MKLNLIISNMIKIDISIQIIKNLLKLKPVVKMKMFVWKWFTNWKIQFTKHHIKTDCKLHLLNAIGNTSGILSLFKCEASISFLKRFFHLICDSHLNENVIVNGLFCWSNLFRFSTPQTPDERHVLKQKS